MAVKSDKVFNDSRESINEIGEVLEAYAKGNISLQNKVRRESERYIAIIDLISVGLLLILSYFVIRSIITPVNELIKVTKIVSSGNLAVNIPVHSKNEIGKLAEAFKAMVTQMRDIVGIIAEKSNLVASSASQMTLNAQQTAAGANETAATMGQIATTVQQLTSNTSGISVASESATKYASQGSDDIKRIAGQMEKINNSSQSVSANIEKLNKKSQEINQIVELITSIADQTNLLALNAAIEAAPGRGTGQGVCGGGG